MKSRGDSWRRRRGCALGLVVAGACWAGRPTFAADGTWKIDASRAWSDPANWVGGVPNGEGDVATFGSIITANRTVTVDGSFTVGRINFGDNNSYTLGGSAPNGLRFDGLRNGHAVISVGAPAASHTLSAPMTLVSSLDVVNATNSALNLNGVISGEGGGLSLAGTVRLGGNNSFTGATFIAGGPTTVITANSANAFGATAAGTTVTDRAVVNFAALGSEPMNVTGGALVNVQSTVAPTSYSAPLSLGGGGRIAFVKAMNLASPVTLPGGEGQLEANYTIAPGASFTGLGTLVLKGFSPVNVNAPINHAGGVTVGADSTVNFNVTHSFPGPLTLRGTLNVNQSQTVSRLVIDGGSYNLAAGKSLNVQQAVDLVGFGTVNLNLGGSLPVNKYGPATTQVAGLGSAYDGPVTITQGTLIATTAGALGSTAGATTVAAATGAVLRIANGVTVGEDIYLDDAAGIEWGIGQAPALSAHEVVGGPSAPAVVTGRVDLGDLGSTVGGGPGTGRLRLAGPITGGGSLTKLGNALDITGDANTYAGITRVREGPLHLIDGGRLASTGGVIVERYGEFEIDNRGASALGDRLADSIPVTLRGGLFRLWGSNTGPVSENVGAVTAATGASRIGVQDYDASNTAGTTLRLASLARGGTGATVDFIGTNVGFANKIFITAPPALNDNAIGGWATIGGRFATYGPTNGVAIAPTVSGNIDTAAPGTNLAITNDVVNAGGTPTLTADRTINSLSIFTNTPIELAGHQLTIDTGGITTFDTQISFRNGRLVAGPGSPGGELFVHAGGDVRISADLPSGALTKTRGGSLFLSGTNTYAGPTTVNEGSLVIEAPSAIPAGNDVDVNGGGYGIAFNRAAPVALRSLRLRGDGTVSSPTPIDAGSYAVESGRLFSRLAGNGTMTKTTDGEVIVRDDNSAYSGTIHVDQGTLTVGDGFISSPKALGNGTTIVKKGGRLAIRNGTVQAKIVMAGGEVLGVNANFSDDLQVVGGGRSALITSETGTGSVPNTVISGNVDVAGDSTLAKPVAFGTLTLTGNAHVDGAVEAAADDGGVTFTPAPGRSVGGAGRIDGALGIGNGGKLAPGNSPGTLSALTATLAPGGAYDWEIRDATGTPGADWDLLDIDGQLDVTATADAKFLIRLLSLDNANAPGALANFSGGQSYTWPIATAGSLAGFSPDSFLVDASAFAPHNALDGGTFDVISAGDALAVRFTPVPEPSAFAAAAATGSALLLARRRR